VSGGRKVLPEYSPEREASFSASPAVQQHPVGETTIMKHDSLGYWKATLALLTQVLIIWFLVSFGAGILFADLLNGIHLGGYPLGFWFAQQGSIYVFIALIFYYAKKMGDIDRRFDVHED
jgi:putative solute:sodium symporter small subunit